MKTASKACAERSVAALYKDNEVAESYIQQRFQWSWSRLLHNTQVTEVNRVIRAYAPDRVLEVAPGPARLTTEIQGVKHGVMIEYSEEMLRLAKRRLALAGCANVWDVRHGNAFELGHLREQFDLSFTFRFIRHFHMADRVRLYQGFRTCLKPNGILVFDVVNRFVREKLSGQQNTKNNKGLEVYDVTYSKKEFRDEMLENGFDVLSMRAVLCHFFVQGWVSHKLDNRLGNWSSIIVRLLENIPSRRPLEWIAICRKID